MEYINDCALPYVALAFSEEKALRQYLESHTMVLLVSAQTVSADGIKIPVIWLSEERMSNENTIFRYQCGAKLVEQITYYFMQLVPGSRERETGIYMVYSPVGRSGKTALALELVRQLPGSLYIGMESYSSLEVAGGTFGHLLYSIMHKEEEILEELAELRSPYYGSYILASALAYYDLRVLDYEHLFWFLERLRGAGEYSAVVLDVDAGVFDTMEVLGCSDRLFMPVLQGERENLRLRSMECIMQAWGYQEIYNRIEFVKLPNAQTQKTEFQKYVRELLA